jgi:hypothetical protein
MLFFEHEARNQALPISLQESDSGQHDIVAYYALDPKERLQTDVPPVWKYPLEYDVLDAMTVLSYGKCPFCEQAGVRMRPYRFRPPAYATPMKRPEDKDSYLWLALHWDNLFPICEGCLPQNKAYFPVDGPRAAPIKPSSDPKPMSGLLLDERPRLYFPGEVSKPTLAFDIALDGTLLGKNRRAELTISHFNLNRPDLLRRRREALAKWIGDMRRSPTVFFSSKEWISKSNDFKETEFGGARYLLLRRIANKLIRRHDPYHALSAKRISRTFFDWSYSAGFTTRLRGALRSLRNEDAGEARARLAQAQGLTDRMAAPALPLVASRLRAATIENYKSLEAISFALPDPPRNWTASQDPDALPPTPCLLILGENSTGKSSILEAIALAAITEEMRDELDLDGRGMTLNPEYMGDVAKSAPRDCRIELEFRDGGKTHLTIDAKSGHMRTVGPSKGVLPPVFAYGAHRLFGKTRQEGHTRRIETLFSNDRQISNPEPWLAGLKERKPEALDEVVSALRHIIRIDGDFRDIEVRPGKADESGRCVINVRKKKPDGGEYIVPQRLDIVSSGYRAVLALVCDVLEGLMMYAAPGASPRDARHGEAIVLIDEIEAHLHPRWKLQIVAGLRRALPGVTFVLTSHDPLCVRGMRDGEVMMLHRYQNTGDDGGSSMPEVVERVADFDNIETMTVEQLLTSDMFQLFSADDRRTDQAFAEVADLLARERASLSERERAILADFNEAIAAGLPYGRTEVTRLVQEAVAEYLALRRKASSGRISETRKKAKAEIRKFLEGLLE